MVGYERITRKRFYELGGFSNPRLVRKSYGRGWSYFLRVES